VAKEKIGVIGAGLMGYGIAYRFGAVGHPVGIFEPVAELRASLAKRLGIIAELLGDDPTCLANIAGAYSGQGRYRRTVAAWHWRCDLARCAGRMVAPVRAAWSGAELILTPVTNNTHSACSRISLQSKPLTRCFWSKNNVLPSRQQL